MAPNDAHVKLLLSVNDENFKEKAFKCCQKTTNVIVCIKCGSIFHLSCSSRKKQKCIKLCDTRIVCETCEQSENPKGNSVSHTQEVNAHILQLEIDFLKTILSEKEEKYKILFDNNQLLKRTNELLEEKVKQKTKEPEFKVINVDKRKNWTSPGKDDKQLQNVNDLTNSKQTELVVTKIPADGTLARSSTSTNFGNEVPNEKKYITSRQMSAAMQEAKTQTVLHNLLNTENNAPVLSESSSNGAWTQVAHRKKRKFLVGSTESPCNIEAVPQMINLHVTRLKPDTKPEQLEKFLENHLDGVKCEIHQSKKPDIYASMKVTIRRDLIKNAWKREIWPSGALVSFFKMRRTLSH
ncbi:uncharacterized protein LOC126888865 [Diabrotica virgifera virgifera]|uniref:Uncharacterized protein n=1 Tax=Diabrotica virgifera virgifera TaxID=50390 RepID=A0ABM5KST4_DIAVI|nr:uncharacterized protein LOC126888865 [Diabrotica virgifera virgifera]